jgi:tripartite-type tricarboxylate transporter receptor subunit TctC
MSKALGKQFYVENRTGAGGNIATEAVARAEPDGHTMQLTLMTAAVNESLFKNFKIRFAEHFEPVGGIAQTGLLLVHPSLEAAQAKQSAARAHWNVGVRRALLLS